MLGAIGRAARAIWRRVARRPRHGFDPQSAKAERARRALEAARAADVQHNLGGRTAGP